MTKYKALQPSFNYAYLICWTRKSDFDNFFPLFHKKESEPSRVLVISSPDLALSLFDNLNCALRYCGLSVVLLRAFSEFVYTFSILYTPKGSADLLNAHS